MSIASFILACVLQGFPQGFTAESCLCQLANLFVSTVTFSRSLFKSDIPSCAWAALSDILLVAATRIRCLSFFDVANSHSNLKLFLSTPQDKLSGFTSWPVKLINFFMSIFLSNPVTNNCPLCLNIVTGNCIKKTSCLVCLIWYMMMLPVRGSKRDNTFFYDFLSHANIWFAYVTTGNLMFMCFITINCPCNNKFL